MTDQLVKTENLYRATLSRIRSKYKVGDYVFVSRYSDSDPNDPWHVGFIRGIGIDYRGGYVQLSEGLDMRWRNIALITKKQGAEIIKYLREKEQVKI